MPTWSCTATCPEAIPDDGEGCPDTSLSCTWDGITCRCEGEAGPTWPGTAAWACATADGCPVSPPADGDPCEEEAQECSYEADLCVCVAAPGPAGELGWDCAAVSEACPATEPEDGEACSSLDLGTACPYGSTTCSCLRQGPGNPSWSCD